MDRRPRLRPARPSLAGATTGVGPPSRRPGAAVPRSAADRPGGRGHDGLAGSDRHPEARRREGRGAGVGRTPRDRRDGPVPPQRTRRLPEGAVRSCRPARPPARMGAGRRPAAPNGLESARRPDHQRVGGRDGGTPRRAGFGQGATTGDQGPGDRTESVRSDRPARPPGSSTGSGPGARRRARVPNGPGPCKSAETKLDRGRRALPFSRPHQHFGRCGVRAGTNRIGARADRSVRVRPMPARGQRRIVAASRCGGREGAEIPSRVGCRNGTKCKWAFRRSLYRRPDLRVSATVGGTKWTKSAKSAPRVRDAGPTSKRLAGRSAGDGRGGGPRRGVRRGGPFPGDPRPRPRNSPRHGTKRTRLDPGPKRTPDAAVASRDNSPRGTVAETRRNRPARFSAAYDGIKTCKFRVRPGVRNGYEMGRAGRNRSCGSRRVMRREGLSIPCRPAAMTPGRRDLAPVEWEARMVPVGAIATPGRVG
jgi:hypothetical protein